MPPNIEKRIAKRIKNFMWNKNNHSPVSKVQIQALINKGEQKVLDIKARNEAIVIMWLKAYLNFGSNRAIWMYFADAIFTVKSSKLKENIDPSIKQNVFLQSWKTNSGNKKNLYKDLKQLLSIAKKYNMRPEGLTFSREILCKMPI